MAWVTPPTFTDGSVLTGAQLNILGGDLNETAAAKATTAGRIFVATGANAIAERAIESHQIVTNEGTASTTYVDLVTPGPTVTLTTGSKALVFITANMHNATADQTCRVGFVVSGATTVATTDDVALITQSATTFDAYQMTRMTRQTLTSGSNTFKMQYNVSGGTGQFQRREIVVIGL